MKHHLDMAGSFIANHPQLNFGDANGVFSCGEDAFFLSPETQTVGVADGVSGWSAYQLGNSAYMAFHMMALIKRLSEAGSKDTNQLVYTAFDELWSMYERKELAIPNGSTTVLTAMLHEDPQSGALHVQYTNLGDSALVIMRPVSPNESMDGSNAGSFTVQLVHQSKRMYLPPEQTRTVPVPMQLCFYPAQGRKGTSSPEQATRSETMNITVQSGDVIILASDGVWDNIGVDHIFKEISTAYASIHAATNQFEKDKLSDNMAKHLSQRLVESAHKANIKPDDITCVIGIVRG